MVMTTEPEHREVEVTLPHDRQVPKLLLNYDEASWSLGACERTLRELVVKGELAIVKIGKRALFDPTDLEALKQSHKVFRPKTG